MASDAKVSPLDKIIYRLDLFLRPLCSFLGFDERLKRNTGQVPEAVAVAGFGGARAAAGQVGQPLS